LPAFFAGSGGFDAVVDGVANKMGQRVAQRFDGGPIELDFSAVNLENPLLFPQPAGQIAHGSRQPFCESRKWGQPGRHHPAVQLAGPGGASGPLRLQRQRPDRRAACGPIRADAKMPKRSSPAPIEDQIERVGPHANGGIDARLGRAVSQPLTAADR